MRRLLLSVNVNHRPYSGVDKPFHDQGYSPRVTHTSVQVSGYLEISFTISSGLLKHHHGIALETTRSAAMICKHRRYKRISVLTFYSLNTTNAMDARADKIYHKFHFTHTDVVCMLIMFGSSALLMRSDACQ